jgi:hypothetical protein
MSASRSLAASLSGSAWDELVHDLLRQHILPLVMQFAASRHDLRTAAHHLHVERRRIAWG